MSDMTTYEWVLMYHPGIRGVADTTANAFETSWRYKGWILVDDRNADGVPEEGLREMAVQRGINVSLAQTKAEMIGIVKEALINGR